MSTAQEAERMAHSSPRTLQPSVEFLPDPELWPGELVSPTSKMQMNARSSMQLPTDRPIVASGHQPILFHPGIVAKLIALDHVARSTGSASVWIVPDQDAVDPSLLRAPIESDGFLDEGSVRFGGESSGPAPSCSQRSIEISDENITEQLKPITSWLMGYEHEESIAKQFASATVGYLCDVLDLEQPTLVYASELIPTGVAEGLVDSILDDPRTAVNAYNASVARFPSAGVRPLDVTDTHIELPFWKIDGTIRTQVMVREGDLIERNGLVPTGLLMTAMMRSQLCELFIHGFGGYEYDQITTDWIKNWLGKDIAPAVGASATLTLAFEQSHDIPSPERAVWKAHHAKHDPAMLGDHAAAEKKQALINAIQSSKSENAHQQTARLFAELQALLAETRSTHSQILDQFQSDVASAHRASKSNQLASDRTWGFPFYTDQQLLGLKDAVVHALSRSR
jgi:hypothetical protein